MIALQTGTRSLLGRQTNRMQLEKSRLWGRWNRDFNLYDLRARARRRAPMGEASYVAQPAFACTPAIKRGRLSRG